MEEIVKVSTISTQEIKPRVEDIVVGKPPWSETPHAGSVERLILQLGAGRGRFNELYGIPRSIGCIGNNRFVLRRKKLGREEIEKILRDFKSMGGTEVWITNYDSPEELNEAVEMAFKVGIEEIRAVFLFEDAEKIRPLDGVEYIAELEYDPEAIISAAMRLWIRGILVMVTPDKVNEAKEFIQKVKGDGDFKAYVDVLYPRSLRHLDFNTIELRKINNPTTSKYHDCLAGTVAVSADGFVLPCPLLRNLVVGDVREKSFKWIVGRSKKLREFWTMTKDKVDGCSTCPLRYICHDCRALEYQASGDLRGIEYCPLL